MSLRRILYLPVALLEGEKFTPLKHRCDKCGADYHTLRLRKPTEIPIRYAKDSEYGERLMCACWRCGFRWSEPTLDNRKNGQ